MNARQLLRGQEVWHTVMRGFLSTLRLTKEAPSILKSLEKFEDTYDGALYRAILSLLVTTPLRLENILQIEKDSFRWVRKGNKKEAVVAIRIPHTRNDIPIPIEIVSFIEQWLERRGDREDPRLFVLADERPMRLDKAAEILKEHFQRANIPLDQAQKLFQKPKIAAEILQVPEEHDAGALVTPVFTVLRSSMTVEEVTGILRKTPKQEGVLELFVINKEGYLEGRVSFRDIVVKPPTTTVGEIMDRHTPSVTVTTDQEECARVIRKHNLMSLPVVDEDRHFIGAIPWDALADVVVEEAGEDILRLGAVSGSEKPYFQTSILSIVKNRLIWLVPLFLAQAFTGDILRFFEEELSRVVMLAFFIPLIIGTGGNAGAQSVATMVRGIALGEISMKDLWRIMWREILIGGMIGTIAGVVAFGRAATWGVPGLMAVTVASTILFIVVWGTFLGSTLPMLARWMKIDPAVMSAPLVTSVVDISGIFVYFLAAKMILQI